MNIQYRAVVEDSFAERLRTIRLKWFENCMRDDGVFVAEDKEIAPYEGITAIDGSTVFPSVPRGLVFGHQMPLPLAERLIACWNAFEGVPTEEIRKRGHARTA